MAVARFHYISIALKLAYNKNKLYKRWSRDILNFDSFEKGLGIVSPSYFVYDFSTQVCLLYSNQVNQAVTSYIMKLTLSF